MKYIGLDYGTKKCGLAVSDDRGSVAVPWKIVSTESLMSELDEMLQNEKFQKLVVGESVKSDGSHNEVFKEVEKFIQVFQDKFLDRVEVIFEKEFFSSKHARSHDGKKEVDDRAAALILQRHLDKQNLHSHNQNFMEEEEM